MSCVMDASALLKGAEKDEGEEGRPLLARRIRPHLAEAYGLHAPGLAAWEIANVVHRKKPEAFGDSVESHQELVEIVLRGVSLDQPGAFHRARTSSLAEDNHLTVYDAAYLELADRREGLLVTEDQALLEAGRSQLGVERSLTIANAFHHIQDGVV